MHFLENAACVNKSTKLSIFSQADMNVDVVADPGQ